MKIDVIRADYNNAQHADAIVTLLNAYASDPMGGGAPLCEFAQANVVNGLQQHPTSITLLAYVDDEAVGVINAFEGFSTFKGKPLINIHDIAVLPEYRGNGIAKQLLQTLEDIAAEKGCCKLTLEVLEGNSTAQRVYTAFGFGGYELDPKAGKALFWEKNL